MRNVGATPPTGLTDAAVTSGAWFGPARRPASRVTSTRGRSRSTRPGRRSSPDRSTEVASTRTWRRRRHADGRSTPQGRHRICTTASTTPASSTPRRARAWDRTRPRSRPPARAPKSEIIRPVLLDPWQAWEVAGSGQLFAEPIPRLRIDRGPKLAARRRIRCGPASLRTGWVKHRTAQLQVSASPSFNVTVLELIPATPRRTGNRSFLRVGLPVIEELARRLEATRTQRCWKKGNDGRIRDR